MARPVLPEMSPWRRRSLTIPPDSLGAWVSLAAWEFWMGALVCGALLFGIRLIVTAPQNIVSAANSKARARVILFLAKNQGVS